ncbi:hypothetical protein HYDPIDRAFT_26429 [Hydnomerulius pinastri MD-312]|uniref:DUF6533 domain-containing protein n=1 Tax=Hydnomerulius pinastri MD-312 TaxID=994086 RepID=A0A0C9W5C7_9AGAM|nr:hypothetical protein HYDPIDRAFT_34856 [Hydnomerulius pinastri MD-312]KIJ67020.1 hypothetical protein HYDPIDRAFT_26429 [Hydnomerulius pinastri MD-312]
MASSLMSNAGGSVADTTQVYVNHGIGKLLLSVFPSARTHLQLAVAIAAVWAYEFIITFDEELTFIRDSRWNYVKVVYLICRYLTFPVVALNIPHLLQLGLSLETCSRYFAFNSFACGIIIAAADLLFWVRNYALWGGRRTAMLIMGFNYLACVVSIAVLLTIFNATVTAFSVVVILTNALLSPPYADLSSNLQAVFHAILVTRMHRELWMADRRKCPETPTEITLPPIQFIDPTSPTSTTA